VSKSREAMEALQAATSRFIANAKEHAGVELDGSLKSLLLVAVALQKYHTLYQRGAQANDPEAEKFAQNIAHEAMVYVSSMMMKAYNARMDTKDGKIVLVYEGVVIPISEMMTEEVKSGKPNSLLLLKLIDDIYTKNSQPVELDSGDLASEAQAQAAIAVQDVLAALKVSADFSLASLAVIDRALQRLKSVAEVAPQNKSALIKASCEKYGSYIGEVFVKQLRGTWAKVRIRDRVVNVIQLGSIYSVPAFIVEAVLEGKKLSLGDQAAETVVQFAALTQERMRGATQEGLFDGLDAPGEIVKRIEPLAREGVRIAKVIHGHDLDYSLFSLEVLDQVVAKHHAKLEADRKVLTDENFQTARAFAALPLGVYLGELIRGAHGGCWENSTGWPTLRQNLMKFDPITVVASFMRGETAMATDRIRVASVKQYYQGIRPLLLDVLDAKLRGAEVSRDQLLAHMGPKRSLNDGVLHFAEACLIYAYVAHNLELDFSENSLLDVDRILEKFYKQAHEPNPAPPAVDPETLCKWFGCYSGEVFRRSLGGIWADDASGTVPPAQGIAHLNWDGNRIFVLNKIGKFLRNGTEDSVAFLLQAVRSLKARGELRPA